MCIIFIMCEWNLKINLSCDFQFILLSTLNTVYLGRKRMKLVTIAPNVSTIILMVGKVIPNEFQFPDKVSWKPEMSWTYSKIMVLIESWC